MVTPEKKPIHSNLTLTSLCKEVLLTSGSSRDAAHPSRDSLNTSRFASRLVQAIDVSLVGENQTWSISGSVGVGRSLAIRLRPCMTWYEYPPLPLSAPIPLAVHRFVVCSLGCGAEVQHENLGVHVDEECPLRRTPCEACGVPIPLPDLSEHLAERCVRVARRCTNGTRNDKLKTRAPRWLVFVGCSCCSHINS